MELVTPLPIWLAAFDKSWQLPALRPFSNTAAYFVVPHCPRGQHDNLASHWSRGIIGQSAWAARYWIGKDHSQSSSVLPLSHVGRNWHKDPIYRIHGTMHATVLSLPSTEKKRLAETFSHSSCCAFQGRVQQHTLTFSLPLTTYKLYWCVEHIVLKLLPQEPLVKPLPTEWVGGCGTAAAEPPRSVFPLLRPEKHLKLK